ncbi:regulatory protein RecX [Rudaeicoccus suwonensis]|uniref:Regulatory protein RecX n=1 Tax=Rudaeicoccus suwonensis TaxID=657409 RepID=A0A561ECI6_9MICO|nr:regulatory protein RecX [Rudaeicoccus suwonensis]TWE13322.1 regulatory protein [Rudaeicoccus suwonensis]
MNPFDRQTDSLPDFIDPAEVVIGPWAGSGAGGDTDDIAINDAGSRPARARSSRRPVQPDRTPRHRREPPLDRTDNDADPHEVARGIVLRQLAAAPRSRKQLADKLRERGCDDDVAQVVLDRMEDVGLIDDEAYAGTLVRSEQMKRGLARRALAQELRRKGISDDIAREQLDTINEDGERERAAALVAKKLRSMHGLDATVQTRRLAGMLARKGYSSSVSWSVIREAIADAPEHQRD